MGLFRSLVFLWFTFSLADVGLIYINTMAVPYVMGWPLYCESACPAKSPTFDACVKYCGIRNQYVPQAMKVFGFSDAKLKADLKDIDPVMSRLMVERPQWFVNNGIVGLAGYAFFVLYWVASLLSSGLARMMNRLVSLVALAFLGTFVVHHVFALAEPGAKAPDAHFAEFLKAPYMNICLWSCGVMPIIVWMMVATTPAKTGITVKSKQLKKKTN